MDDNEARWKEWAKKVVADMPPMTAEDCEAVARILDDCRIAQAEAALAKRKESEHEKSISPRPGNPRRVRRLHK